MDEFVVETNAVAEPGTDVVPVAALAVDPVAWKQAGILTADGSPSMTWELAEEDDSAGMPARTKGAALDAATKGFFAQMETSRVKRNFAFGNVAFDGKVSLEEAPVPLDQIDHLGRSFDPTIHSVTGGTAIHAGLEAAYRLSRQWLESQQGSLPVTVVIAVLTDGECGDPQRTLQLAEKIKREEPRISIAAGMFATKGSGTPGAALLQSIVSEPRLYAVIYSADQLRQWFHASLTATGVAARSEG